MAEAGNLVLKIDSTGVVSATGNLEKFSREAGNAERSATSLDDVFSRMNMTSLAAVAGITTLVNALGNIKSALLGAVNTYSGFEQIEVGLSGVMKNLGNTKRQSDDFLKSLKNLSNETTFGYNTLANAAQQMLTVGVSTDEVKKRLIQLGNAAGGSTDKFNRLAEIYSNILATGKAGAVQIQQLTNITGTSWVNALGKTSASAEEVTAQIEALTSAGGMLEGAMDSLIDTVEGKQGFVSDWFDEMTRNFAEASGLVDVYRVVMDAISDGLANLAGWFEKINENPFYKAIFSGAMAAVLAGLVTIIGVALVGAVIKLNAQLAIMATLKTIINPVAAAVGLGAAAVVGATAGLVAYKKAQDNVKASAEEANEELQKQAEKLRELKTLYDSGDYSNYYSRLVSDKKAELAAEQEKLAKLQNDLPNYEGYKNAYTRQINDIEHTKSKIQELTAAIDEYESRISGMKLIDSVYAEYIQTSKDGEIEKIKSQIEELQKIRDLTETKISYDENGNMDIDHASSILSEEQRRQVEIDIAFLQSKLEELQKKSDKTTKAMKKGLEDWQEALKQAFSFSDYDVKQGAVDRTAKNENGDGALEYWEKKVDTLKAKTAEINNIINGGMSNEADAIQQKIDTLVSAYNTLVASPSYTGDEESLKQYVERLKELRTAQREARVSDETKNLSRDTDILKAILTAEEDLEEKSVLLLHYEDKVTEEQERRLIAVREENDLWQERAKLVKDIAQAQKDGDINGYLSNKQALAGSYLKENQNAENAVSYLGANAANTAMSMSSDVGNFAQGMAEGGIIGGAINAVIGSLEKVAGSVEGMDDVLNPLTAILKVLTPIFEGIVGVLQPIFAILKGIQEVGSALVEGVLKQIEPLTELISGFFETIVNLVSKLGEAFEPVIDVLMMVVNEILGAVNGSLEPLFQLFDILKNLNDVFKALFEPIDAIVRLVNGVIRMVAAPLRIVALLLAKLAETIRKFTQPFMDFIEGILSWIDRFFGTAEEIEEEQDSELERLRALNDEYKALYSAMKEQEEYYLSAKMALNAETYNDNVTGVNDMILTPKGTFSTSPQDTIIAMKHPEDLAASGGASVSVVVNNYSDSKVATSKDDMGNLVVTISQAVAKDYESGANGWENAYNSRMAMLNGTRVSI